MIPLTSYGVLAIEGPDAEKFLQGQLTADVSTLALGEGKLAAHCQPQGRVISLFILFRTTTAYYLAMPNSIMPLALTALKKYAVFYKVSFSNPTDLCLGLSSATSHTALANAALTRTLTLSLTRETIDATDESAERLLIQHGIPSLTPETSGQFLPHELNLITLNAVSFTKGCYTGQEIVARMEYRGTLKKALILAAHEGSVERLEDVFLLGNATSVGTVVDTAKKLSLLLVNRNAIESNTFVTKTNNPYTLISENEPSL
jgi:folate-binding protein YgfZ